MGLGDTNPYQHAIYINKYIIHSNEYYYYTLLLLHNAIMLPLILSLLELNSWGPLLGRHLRGIMEMSGRHEENVGA